MHRLDYLSQCTIYETTKQHMMTNIDNPMHGHELKGKLLDINRYITSILFEPTIKDSAV